MESTAETIQDEIDLLWEEAVTSYVRNTKKSPSTPGAEIGTVRSAEDLARHIGTAAMSFSNFRSRRERLWRVLRAFVVPISTLAQIAITPASGGDYGVFSGAVLGAIVHLLRSCEGVSNAYDWVEQVFGELREFSDRLAMYVESPTMEPLLRKKIVAILGFVLAFIGHTERLIRENRFREYLKVTFLSKDPQLQRMLEDLNQLFEAEQRFVLAAVYRSTRTMEDNAVAASETIGRNLQVSEQTLGAVRDSRAVEDKKRLQQILCSTCTNDDVEDILVRNERSLTAGTGEWLWSEQLFTSWMSHQTPILWILGGPGKGKSFLATWIIKQLKADSETKQRFSLGYFFVRENNENLRDSNAILKAIAWQIASQDAEFEAHAVQVSYKRSRLSSAEDTWQNIFTDFYDSDVRKDSQAMIVIDGLDEATQSTRRTILGLLKNLPLPRKCKAPKLQFAIIGRKDLLDDANFTRLEKIQFIEVTRRKNQSDITRYIHERVAHIQVLHEIRKRRPGGVGMANRLGSYILKKVSQGSDGVFLWAKLLLDDLMRKDCEQIETALANPPSNLDDMIALVFQRLAEDQEIDGLLLRKVLLLMAHARRPLCFGELYAALSCSGRKPRYLFWNQVRGKLSSVFDLRFPYNVDPDVLALSGRLENYSEKQGQLIEDTNPTAEEEYHFDFSASEDSDPLYDNFLGDWQSDESQATPISELDSLFEDFEASEHLFSPLSKNHLLTGVTFCHARIRDYLVSQQSRNQSCPSLDPTHPSEDPNYVISTICLDMLGKIPDLTDFKFYLGDYPLQYLPSHLATIDRYQLSGQNLGDIIQGLYWLFGTPEGTCSLLSSVNQYSRWQSSHGTFWNLWVKTDENLRLVQDWFANISHAESVEGWGESIAVWISLASQSLEVLLRPMLASASAQWLSSERTSGSKHGEMGEFQAWLLHGWLSWIDCRAPASEMEDPCWRAQSYDLRKLSSKRIEYIAGWSGLEQDARWHTRLGDILLSAKHYRAAETHFHRATQLDLACWTAFRGLAHCAATERQYEAAISWQNRAISILSDANAHKDFASIEISDLWMSISEWAQLGEDLSTAYEAAEHGYEEWIHCTSAQTQLVKRLIEDKDHVKTIQTLRRLHETRSSDGQSSPLASFFISAKALIFELGTACRKEGLPIFILNAIDEAISYLNSVPHEDPIEFENTNRMLYCSGIFHYKYYGSEDEAMRLLEILLVRLKNNFEVFPLQWAPTTDFIVAQLAQFYFDAAVDDLEKDDMRVDIMSSKLEALSQLASSSSIKEYGNPDIYVRSYASLLWGRWLREHQGAERTTWKGFFKEVILADLDSVRYDDPGEDAEGLRRLARSLIQAGDKMNGAAILAALFKTIEKQNEWTEQSEQREEQGCHKHIDPKLLFPLPQHVPSHASTMRGSEVPHLLPIRECHKHYKCDHCRQTPASTSLRELYICEICPHNVWCGECLEQLGDPERRVLFDVHSCNPNHVFYRAWPVPEEASCHAAQLLENGVIARKAWLESLRNEWRD